MTNEHIYSAYEKIADTFAELAPDKDYNAHYDRPAIISLLNEVNAQNILDAGCGPGIYSEMLIKNGATITGIDISDKMIEHAIKRNGKSGNFIKHNLEKVLPFGNNEFDGVLSALTISYISDLKKLFKEINRIIKPNGWFVFSTEHPFFTYRYHNLKNYYDVQKVSCVWKGFNKQPIEMVSYHHSLGYIFESLNVNNFIIENVLEAKPTEEFKNQNPKDYNELMEFPSFINFKAKKCAP